MANIDKGKTPGYTRKANKTYHDKHDKLQLMLEPGELSKIRGAGIKNADIVAWIREEYKRRISENEKSKDVDDEVEEFQRYFDEVEKSLNK